MRPAKQQELNIRSHRAFTGQLSECERVSEQDGDGRKIDYEMVAAALQEETFRSAATGS